MADAQQRLSLIITAQTAKAQQEIAAVGKRIDTFKTKVGDYAKTHTAMFAAIGAAAVAFGVSAVKAFAESEKYSIRLQQSVENTGDSWAVYGGHVEDAVGQMMMLGAYTDEELNAGLARLTQATGDVNEALDLMSLAMDVARGTGKPLEDTAVTLAKVYAGNVGVLRRFGIEIGNVSDSEEALAILQQKFAGQAEAYGESTEGSLLRIKIALDELKEAFGKGLAEGFGGGGVGDVADGLLELSDTVETAGRAITGVFDGIADAGVGFVTHMKWLLGDLDTVTQTIYEAWLDSSEFWTTSFWDFSESVRSGETAIDGLYVALDDTTTATGEMAEQAEEAASVMDDWTRAMDGTTTAAGTLDGVLRGLTEQQWDSELASIAARDAERRYQEVLADETSTADEVEEARIRMEQAALKAADAEAELAVATASAADVMGLASDDPAYIEWLLRVRDAARDAAARVGDLQNRAAGAAGGATSAYKGVTQYGAGGVVDGPEFALVGERSAREYVITTEAGYRSRSLALFGQLARDLGVTAPAMPKIGTGGGGGTSNAWTINVHANSAADVPVIRKAVDEALRSYVRTSTVLGRT